MNRLYQIASIIYRVGLILAILFYLMTLGVNDDESAYYHSNLKSSLTLFFLFGTITIMTIYQTLIIRNYLIKKTIQLVLIGLAIVNLLFTLNLVHSMILGYRNLSIGDSIVSIIIFLFSIVTTIVLWGLTKKYYEKKTVLTQ